jgi:Holliday junction DNA helicase RuvB
MAIIASYNQEPQKPIISLDPVAGTGDKVCEGELSNSNNALRPDSFDHYIGQEKLHRILKIAIDAAQKRQDPSSLGHILLHGPPGLGKTSCAYLIAKTLGTQIKVFSAPALERPKDILGIVLSLQAGDVLFIDEIHRLNKVTEELLYPALEDFQIDLTSGKGNSSRAMRLDINRFILVGATTKLGSISAPLRDRFTHIHRMEYYSPEELCSILQRNARLLDVKINPAAAMVLAKCSRGTPRVVNRLLRLVRDYAHHREAAVIDENLANIALNLYHIDKSGLEPMDRKILRVLVEHYNGGPAGLEAIASLIGEDKNTIEDFYEPFLMQSGLLKRTQRGRMVTEAGFSYLQNLI